MDQLSQQNGFIPRKSVVDTTLRSGGNSVGIISLISISLFIVAAVAAAGVFLYDQILEKQKETKQAQLAEYEAQLKQPVMHEIKTVDTRLIASETRLNNHIALSTFLDALSRDTLRNVQWRSMRFESQLDGTYTVSFDGQARSFASVALQADQFAANPLFTDSLVSNLNKTQQGSATFALRATVDPKQISYKNYVAQYYNPVLEDVSTVPASSSFGEDASESSSQGSSVIEDNQN